MKPQTSKVRAHLMKTGSITPIHAFKFMGIYRLASRICELRASGMMIVTRQKKSARGKMYCKYTHERSQS